MNHKLLKTLSGTLTFVFALYAFPTISSTLSNASMLGTAYSDPLLKSLYAGLAIFAIVFTVLALASEKFNTILRLILIVLATSCVANSSIFLWNFGVIDGSIPVIVDQLPKLYIEIAFFAALTIAVYFFRHFINVNYIRICILIFLLAGLPLTTQALPQVHAEKDSDEILPGAFDFSDTTILKYSKKHNIFVVLLDAMQTDNFLEAVNDLNLKESLRGFTCFINNSGVSRNTTFSVPAALTGHAYKGDTTKAEFQATMSGASAIPAVMRAHEYDTRIFSQHTIPYQKSIVNWDNVTRRSKNGTDITNWLSIQRLALYKVSPLPAKLLLRNELLWTKIESEFIQAFNLSNQRLAPRFDDAGILSRLAKEGKVELEKPAFRWFHLQGIHPPYTLVPESEQETRKYSSMELAKIQGERLMAPLISFLESLQRLEVYDKSTIIIMADHGKHNIRKPVMLVKRAGDKHDFNISYAPTSIIDLPATIFSEAGITSQPKSEGINLFDVTSPRDRIFYDFLAIDPNTGLPNKIEKLVLSENENEPGNWKSEWTIFPALEARGTNTHFIEFSNGSFDERILQGNYRVSKGGTMWQNELEVFLPTNSSEAAIIEILYYKYQEYPVTISISIDGQNKENVDLLPHGHLYLYKPKSDDGQMPIKFATVSPKKKDDSILFVNLLYTELKQTETSTLRPAKSGINMKLKAAWGAGGDWWRNDTRVLVVSNGIILDTTTNVANKFYSFSLPANVCDGPMEYSIINYATGEQGPLNTLTTNCQ